MWHVHIIRTLFPKYSIRSLSTVFAEQQEQPYVHIADRVISKGRTCVSRVQHSSLDDEITRKPSFRNISTNYIFDRAVARKVAALVLPHHSAGKIFIEINPGIGCLTAELLNSGVNSLHLIEANQSFLEYLKAYRSFSKNVTISSQRFSYFGDAVSMSSLWIESLMPNWKWEENSQVSVFSIIPSRQERFLLPWLVNMISSWHDYGRVKCFFVISDRLYWRCSNPQIATAGNFKHYTVGHILATTLFDIKPLAKMDKTEFVPPISVSHVEQHAKIKLDNSKFQPSKMVLASIEPRHDLDKLLTLGDCSLFAAFVRQLTARRHARLIPTCERLLPGIGLALLDIPDVTSPSVRIGDLKPHSFLHIFQIMKKSPYFVPELFLPVSNNHQSNTSQGVPEAHEYELAIPSLNNNDKKQPVKANVSDIFPGAPSLKSNQYMGSSEYGLPCGLGDETDEYNSCDYETSLLL